MVMKRPSSKMCCCGMINGAALVGTLQTIIVVFMMAGSGLVLDRYRWWEQRMNDPDRTTTPMPTTTTQVPTVPYHYVFPDYHSVTNGWMVVITGTVDDAADSFSVDLNCGETNSDDIAMHFMPRYDAWDPKHVARNTREDGAWHINEEQDGTAEPIPKGSAFVLKIEAFLDYYEVTINNQVFTRYNHRIDYDCVESVSIYGGLTLDSVEYYWTDGSSEPKLLTEAWLEFGLAHHLGFLAVWLATMLPYALAFYYYDAMMVMPNLLMLALQVLATFVIVVLMLNRLFDPEPSHFQHDEYTESAIIYVVTALMLWFFVMIGFAFCVYKFYIWLKYEERQDRERLTDWDGNEKSRSY